VFGANDALAVGRRLEIKQVAQERTSAWIANATA
jgi:hypothetical protein